MRAGQVVLRAGLGLVGLVAAVAVAGASAAWWAQTDAGERQIVRWVNGALERRIVQGGVAIGSLDLGWGRVAVDGIRVDGAETDGVVVIPRVAARFEPAALLTGTVHVTTLDVVAPHVRVATTPDGLDLPVFASTAPTPPDDGPTTYLPAGLTLRIDRLRLRDADVAAPEADVAVRRMNAEAALTVDHDVVDVGALFAVWRQDAPALGPVQLGADLRLVNDDLVRLSAELGAAGARGRVRAAGVGVFDPAHARVEVQATGTAGPDARRALADAFGAAVPDALAEAPPLTASVDLGGGRSSAAAAFSAWWTDAATLEVAELGPAVAEARATGSLDPAWQAAFDVGVPALAELLVPLGFDVSGAVRATGAAGATAAGGVAGTVELDLAEVSAAGAAVTAVHAPLSFEVPADGPPTVSGTARLAGIVGPSVRVRAAEASFDLAAGDVPVGVVRAETRTLDVGPDGEVPLRGRFAVNLDPDQVRVNMSWTDRRSADRAFTAIGRLNTNSGDVRLDELSVRTTRDVVWRNQQPITGTVADGGLDDVRFDLESAAGHVRVVGSRIDADTIDLGAEMSLSVAHAVEVASPLLDDPLPPAGGQLAARVDLRVGRGPPEALGRITGTGVSVRDQLDRADFELRTRVRGDRAELVGVARPTDGEPVASGELSVPLVAGKPEIACGGSAAARLDVPTTSWEALQSLFPALPEAPDDLSVPALRAQAWAVGDPCDPNTNVAVTFDPGVPDRAALVTVAARDAGGSDTLEAGVIVASPDGEPWAMGRGSVAHPDLAAWAAAPDELGIGAWQGELRALGLPLELGLSEVSGSLVGTATAAGDGARVARTAGRLGTSGATAHGLPVPVTTVAWDTVGDDLQATIDAANAFGGFSARGAVGLPALHDLGGDAPVRVDVTKGVLPLLMVDVFTDQLSDGAGLMRISGGVRGTVARPDADLAVSIRDGALTAVETGVRYDDITLDARIEGRSLTIRDLRLGSRPKYGRYALTDDNDVNLRVSGAVDVDDDGTIRPAVQARLDRLWVMANETGLVQLSGGVRVSGETPALEVDGRLAVDEARVRLERHLFVSEAADHLDDDIVFAGPPPDLLRTRDAEEAPSLADAVAEQVDVSVSVDVSRPVALDATVPLLDETAVPIGSAAADVELSSTVSGRVRFDKRRARNDLDGRLQAEGSVDLFGARFDIAEGTIAFAGTDPTEPNVEFALERDTQGYGTVTARITGTPSALRVEELTSDEFEDPGDVMALLLFGRPLSELGTGQSRAGAEIVQDALVNAAGAELEDLIGVELVDQVEYSAGSGLSLGWSIGTDGFFTVRLDPSAEEDENRTEAEVTWRIGRDTQAELGSGDAAVTSGWLEWERRF